MKDNDAFGNRMKTYEGAEAMRTLLPLTPIMVRLDGKNFHTFTKGLKRPFDIGFSTLMVETTKFLVDKLNAKLAYTQSDEISLTIYNKNYSTEPLFSNRVQKLTSVIASMCTAYFNSRIPEFIPSKKDKLAFFDCRVWNVPNLMEATNNYVWREVDATKNSIAMAAQAFFSHKQLQNKSGSEMQDMLMLEKGVNWNDYPAFFKRGTYVRRSTKVIPYTNMEIEKLPPKHAARTNPDLKIVRSVVEVCDFPPILKIMNREDVLFSGYEIMSFEQLQETNKRMAQAAQQNNPW